MSNNDKGLYPPLPEEVSEIMERMAVETTSVSFYESLLESQCGASDDSQPVEQYDGSLGVSVGFVNTHQSKIGQLQWNDNLGQIYTEPGNVSGVRWCTGTLISHNLFLTAGHCFDSTGGGWQRPRQNGSTSAISPQEIAQNMHVNFNYQIDPSGQLRQEVQFEIEELIEYRNGDLDYAIVRLAGSPGIQFGIGQIAPNDGAVGDMLCIIGHPAGVPKRIEAGPLTQLVGDKIRYNDIDTLGGNSGSAIWQASSGKIVGVHTNGGCNTAGTGSNSGVRISKIIDNSPTVQNLLSPSLRGIFRIQQKSNNRYLDAYQTGSKDYSAVTRTSQNNDTQRWILSPVGKVFQMMQKSSSRFMDAHESSAKDFSAVTRTFQDNDTQRWVFVPANDFLNTYTIQQLKNGRYLDAHVVGSDFSVVTRTAQNNDTQRWILTPISDQTYRIQQQVNGRYLDAHESSANDFSVVTRSLQSNATQEWVLCDAGTVYAIQQKSTNRDLDAHETSTKDFSVVTRTTQNNDTQLWVLTYQGGDAYTIQQLKNGRFLDAHETSDKDFNVVTRTRQNNDTQRWIIKKT